MDTLTTYSAIGRLIRSIAFSPNGRYFAASAGGVGGVMLWRIQPGIAPQGKAKAGLRMERVDGPTRRSMVVTLAINPDSDILAWMDAGVIQLWDLAKAQEHPFPPVRLAASLYCLAFHPATKHLMFVAATGVPEAWDITTGQKVGSFGADDIERSDGTMPTLNSVIALSSEGDRLATCRGRFVDVWDTADRKLLLKLPVEQGGVWSLAWSPNGKLLAIGSSDGGLVIWNLPKIKEQLDAIGLVDW